MAAIWSAYTMSDCVAVAPEIPLPDCCSLRIAFSTVPMSVPLILAANPSALSSSTVAPVRCAMSSKSLPASANVLASIPSPALPIADAIRVRVFSRPPAIVFNALLAAPNPDENERPMVAALADNRCMDARTALMPRSKSV